VNILVALINLGFMGVTIFMMIKRDIRDEFVRRALIFLIVALSLRIVMSTGAAI
jgi:hypothetical protein